MFSKTPSNYKLFTNSTSSPIIFLFCFMNIYRKTIKFLFFTFSTSINLLRKKSTYEWNVWSYLKNIAKAMKQREKKRRMRHSTHSLQNVCAHFYSSNIHTFRITYSGVCSVFPPLISYRIGFCCQLLLLPPFITKEQKVFKKIHFLFFFFTLFETRVHYVKW